MSDRIKLLLTEERKLDEHRLLKEKKEAELQARIKALEEREVLVQDETTKRQRLMLMKQEEDRLEKILLQKIKTDIQMDERMEALLKREKKLQDELEKMEKANIESTIGDTVMKQMKEEANPQQRTETRV